MPRHSAPCIGAPSASPTSRSWSRPPASAPPPPPPATPEDRALILAGRGDTHILKPGRGRLASGRTLMHSRLRSAPAQREGPMPCMRSQLAVLLSAALVGLAAAATAGPGPGRGLPLPGAALHRRSGEGHQLRRQHRRPAHGGARPCRPRLGCAAHRRRPPAPDRGRAAPARDPQQLSRPRRHHGGRRLRRALRARRGRRAREDRRQGIPRLLQGPRRPAERHPAGPDPGQLQPGQGLHRHRPLLRLPRHLRCHRHLGRMGPEEGLCRRLHRQGYRRRRARPRGRPRHPDRRPPRAGRRGRRGLQLHRPPHRPPAPELHRPVPEPLGLEARPFRAQPRARLGQARHRLGRVRLLGAQRRVSAPHLGQAPPALRLRQRAGHRLQRLQRRRRHAARRRAGAQGHVRRHRGERAQRHARATRSASSSSRARRLRWQRTAGS